MRLLLFIPLLAVSCYGEWQTYEGYQVLSVKASDRFEQDKLRKLQEDHELDFWDDVGLLSRDVQIMVPPHRKLEVKNFLSDNEIEFTVFRSNVAEVVEKERARLANKRDYEKDDFNRYEEIMEQMEYWVQVCPDGFECSTYSIGDSYEKRELKVFRITKPGETRQAVFIDSLIHAREWLAGATVLRILERLVTEYGADGNTTSLMDDYDWYFLPVLNPDGYIYSFNTSRYWRKSRNNNPGSTCMGVDLNRNFDVYWGTVGSSNNPCSDTFRGALAASEPETQAVQNEALRLKGKVLSWHTWHSKATMILHPYGHSVGGTCVISPDHDKQNQVGKEYARAVRETYNEDVWPFGNSCQTIYATSGSSQDYAYDYGNVTYAYTPETRGEDWVIDPSEIVKSYLESWNGIVATMAEIKAIEGTK